ncbi:PotD/PotF family extracellular solute-binding protein [Natronomonas gomsonensis]|uniref:ABC transporter substrate-binding protein n=1 Tax=Natronomonas gomsonensis TaxID=1046043 RepID=UPI0020CA4595|nr:PotD/PotF family extracellular solute-binding protein [Natronomonas gomsonensis]MCY4731793.1 PotD/PotF family extracellular solute-binding protein [Natronomonas gomsonensis]
MSKGSNYRRRDVLTTVGAGTLAGLAGCLGGNGGGNGNGNGNGNGGGNGGGGGGGELRFLGFGGNTQEAQMTVFEPWAEETGTEVSGTEAGGTTEMISLIKQNPGSFDIVALNDTGMARAQQEDVIEPIDLSMVPNYEKNIKESARSLSFNVDGDDTMGLIRENGATGYAYNTEKVDGELSSWEDIKDPAYEGKVSLIDRTIDRLSNCAAAADLNVNEVPGDEAKTDQMFTEAEEQDQNVFNYWGDGATSIRYLRQENAWICEAWGGRVLALQEEGYDHIEYVIPEEGAMGWTDNLAIVKGTESRELAHELLNHTYQREHLLTLSDMMNYTVQVKNPPEKMTQLPDYAPAEDLAFRDWDVVLPKEDAWTDRLNEIKQG